MTRTTIANELGPYHKLLTVITALVLRALADRLGVEIDDLAANMATLGAMWAVPNRVRVRR